MHQGVGLDSLNRLPVRKAVHAFYECCNSVSLAGDLAAGRPYPDRDALFRRADALLFALPEDAVGQILEAYPRVGRRPGSARSHAEMCSLWDERPGVMQLLDSAAQQYADKFGFEFVMKFDHAEAGAAGGAAPAVIAAISERMHHDVETERKVLRNEIARINRCRLERMLGPEGGYDNWS